MIEWIKTKLNRPPRGRILVWVDDEAFSADVLANGIVNCPTLELTWDLTCDPISELFEYWAELNEPK
jgi:hypothetical protein